MEKKITDGRMNIRGIRRTLCNIDALQEENFYKHIDKLRCVMYNHIESYQYEVRNERL